MPARRSGIKVVLASLGICLALWACSPAAIPPPPAAVPGLRWPAPPGPARIAWVKEIRDYRDVGIRPGFWQRLGARITGTGTRGIIKPYGIFADGERLYIVDVASAGVHIMDGGEGRYLFLGEGEENMLRTPIGISGDGDGNVYITDPGAAAVFRFDGKTLRPFITGLGRPTGIAFNASNGLLYVTDTAAHQVVAFTLLGVERFRIGERGGAPGQFNYPTDIFVDGGGHLYVTDALNARIQMFTETGLFRRTFGQAGDTAGHFIKPKGIAVDSEGHIYVCDALLDAVQIFDQSGRLLLDFGGNGTGAGEFWMPSGLHIDKRNFIYVADTYNRRVQVFRYLPEGAKEQ